MASFRLSDGQVVLIDDDDVERVFAKRWYRQHRYAVNGRGGSKPTPGGRIYLHRFIMNAPSDVPVDHINGDGFDCRKANLRLATPSLNNANRRSPKRALPRGVYTNPNGTYRAQITVRGKDIALGCHATVQAAAEAYASAARDAFGDFAHPESIRLAERQQSEQRRKLERPRDTRFASSKEIA